MFDGLPAWALFAFFFAGAVARGGFTYGLGRGLRAADTKKSGFLTGERVARAEQLVRRFGAPAVSLAFLTVGVQSAVMAAAGVLRMPARRFVPALVVGGLIWATIYTTIGLAVIYAFWGRAETRWLLAAALAAAVVAGATRWLRHRLAARGAEAETGGETAGAALATEVEPVAHEHRQ